MTQEEFKAALNRAAVLKEQSLADRARFVSKMADEFWASDIEAGRVTRQALNAAKTAAMEVSVVAAGGLHLLRRAPADCPQRFGIFGRSELA